MVRFNNILPGFINKALLAITISVPLSSNGYFFADSTRNAPPSPLGQEIVAQIFMSSKLDIIVLFRSLILDIF